MSDDNQTHTTESGSVSVGTRITTRNVADEELITRVERLELQVRELKADLKAHARSWHGME